MKKEKERKLVRYPTCVLRKKAEDASISEAKEIVERMMEVIKDEDGAGLAAPQIGVSKRVIIVRTEEGFLPLINPKITFLGIKKIVFKEGCLSLKGMWLDIERYLKIKVEAQNINGEDLSFEAEGVLSVVIQHEVDHLDGVLIVDRIGGIKKIRELFKYYLEILKN